MRRLLLVLAISLGTKVYGQILPMGTRYAGSGTPQAAAPTFSPASTSGSCSGTCSITISSTTPSATLTYCTNASADCTPGTTYVSAVSFSTSGTHLCAFTTASGYTQSTTHCETYTVGSSVLISDNFSGTNGTSISGRELDCALGGTCTGSPAVSWSLDAGSGGSGITIQTNTMTNNLSAGFRATVANWTPPNGDYLASAKFVTMGSSYPMVCVRCRSSDSDGYAVYAGGGQLNLVRYDLSTLTVLVSGIGSVANGDIIGLQAIGTGNPVTIKVFKDTGSGFVQVGSDYLDTDSTNRKTAAGTAGVRSLDTGSVLAQFKVQ